MYNNTSHLAKVYRNIRFLRWRKTVGFFVFYMIIYDNNICDTVHCRHATWNLFVNVLFFPLKSQGVLVGRWRHPAPNKEEGRRGEQVAPSSQGGWVRKLIDTSNAQIRVSKQFYRVLLRITAPGGFFFTCHSLSTIQQAFSHSNKLKRRVEVKVDKTTANVAIIVTRIWWYIIRHPLVHGFLYS